MNKNKIFLIILSLVFGSISLYGLNKYLILKNEIDKPISYSFVSTKVNSETRGKSYYLLALYQGNEYEVAITSKDYLDINRKKKIELYYSSDLKQVFSRWEVKKNFRIACIFFIFSAIACGSLFFMKPKEG